MVSETVIAAIMAASVTGAGLVIAFYALIARMSDRIFENRLTQLDEPRQEIKKITSKPESFNEDNFDKTTKRFKELGKKINSVKTYPRYLGPGIVVDFVLFIMAAIFSLSWLTGPQNAPMADAIPTVIFLLASFTFLVVGVYGIFDVHTTMTDNFRKLKEKKENLKVELREAPQEAEITGKVAQFLDRNGIIYARDRNIKINGERMFADFIIYPKEKPEYIVEVLTKPTSQNVYRTSEKYEMYKQETGMKTILISDFSINKPVLRYATSYWDFVVDVNNLDELKRIIKS